MFVYENLLSRLFWFLIPLLYLADADPPALPPAPPAPPPAPPSPPLGDPNAGMQALIQRYNNDLARVIEHLYGDNYNLREKNRELKVQVKDMEGKAPGQGYIILKEEDAKLLEAYKALGDIEALKTLQGERDQFKGELGALRKDGVLRDVAEAVGFKFGVLKTLSENKSLNGETELEFEIREIEKDGKKSKAAFVKNGSGEPKALGDYAKEKWADFLPSLQAQPTQPAGTPYPNQSAGGPPPQTDILTDFKKKSQEARAAQSNPLKAGK